MQSLNIPTHSAVFRKRSWPPMSIRVSTLDAPRHTSAPHDSVSAQENVRQIESMRSAWEHVQRLDEGMRSAEEHVQPLDESMRSAQEHVQLLDESMRSA